MSAKSDDKPDSQGMYYLESLPRRVVTIYVPLGIFVFVLLFPFYWMTITAFKPNAELLSHEGNPFWVFHPTFDHFVKLLFNTPYPEWMLNTLIVSVSSTFFSLAASVFAAYAIERLRFKGSKQMGSPSSWRTWFHLRSCSFRWQQSWSISACSIRAGRSS